MDSSSPENLFGDKKKAIHELTQGRELANHLRNILIGKPFGDRDRSSTAHTDSPWAVDDLVMKILRSFTDTISILNRRPTDHEVSDQIRVNTGVKFEDSEESSKSTTPTLKERRGCYKRRKASQSWTRLTPNLIDDGHAWRKYGQKVILNAKHPRNYYRCTHKFDQGCQATKQVQRTEDDPPMYRTTYHGNHTCQNLLKPPQIILDSTTSPRDSNSSFYLSFGSSHNNTYPNNNNNKLIHEENYFPTLIPLVKQEFKEETKTGLNHHMNNQSSQSSDYFLSHGDLTAFDSSGPMPVLSSGGSGDVISSSGVYSCTASTHDSLSLDMDLVVGVGDFDDDVLQFEF